jgi:predicted ATPase
VSSSLIGLKFSGYRAFNDERQKLFPLGRLNIFIGENNSGKSTVLNFLNTQYPFSDKPSNSFLDKHVANSALNASVALAVDWQKFESLFDDFPIHQPTKTIFLDNLKRDIGSDEVVWLDVSKSGSQRNQANGLLGLSAEHFDVFDDRDYKVIQSKFLSYTGGNRKKSDEEIIANIAQRLYFSVPSVTLIPATRFVSNGEVPSDAFGGAGLIEQLAALQNPDVEHRADREKFRELNSFVADVLGKKGAMLDIPHTRDKIILISDGKELPLSSVGFGVHQLIIMAARCLLENGKIICIEEPEAFLHPRVLKKFLQYLLDRTDNQYFVSTHAASLIDFPDANVFSVSNDGVRSRVSLIGRSQEKYKIARQMGYSPSDLLQSPCVIWVEGPSDRIYLRSWIGQIDGSLVEGRHYSIMFYGGRLLSHLSAADEETTDFIELLSRP